ncbi:Rieske (2Fe-2S) protein [Mumia zhuanghuii]|uniref:Cytochrome bc1 complex Rieske iron-sulfur subunit n=2 Tax=Mumia TaxID=1546255 RepID=A0ABW1QPX9_9ACTN|nr:MULTISPECIES: Rieske (2Fe-2S) protein [Mumia]KAA1420007.1 Rieske (2Fe-2S) protein [Mumia zhuanghuii]
MTDNRSTASSIRRRTVIHGAGAVGGTVVAGGLLAACGSDGGSSSGETSAPPAESATSPAPEATTEGGATTGGGTELGPASDVQVGSGRFYESEKVIVTQPTEGTFKGFSSVCTHQGCAVSMVEDAVMICPCHGSEFSISDGAPSEGPAEQPLESREVRVDGDTIFLV